MEADNELIILGRISFRAFCCPLVVSYWQPPQNEQDTLILYYKYISGSQWCISTSVSSTFNLHNVRQLYLMRDGKKKFCSMFPFVKMDKQMWDSGGWRSIGSLMQTGTRVLRVRQVDVRQVVVVVYLSEAPCSMSDTLSDGQQAGWDGLLLQLSYTTHTHRAEKVLIRYGLSIESID